MGKTPTYDENGADLLTTADVRDNLVEDVRGSAEFGPQAQTGADKALGQLLDAPADQLGQAYEALQDVIDSRDPDSAEGVHLDNLCKLSGISRNPATYSQATLTVDVDNGETLTAGHRARVTGGPTFATDEDVLGDGSGTQTVPATCTVAGAQEAGAGDIDEIVDSETFWQSVTNAAAAITGSPIETDVELRHRRRRSLSRGGTSRAAAIAAALEELDFVEAATCLENTTNETDAKGLPPHSIRPMVWPTGLSTDQEKQIISTLWLVCGAGIMVDGDQQYTVTQPNGKETPLAFSYGTGSEIWIVITHWTNDDYPSDGDAQIATRLKLYDNDYSLGTDVIPWDLGDYLRDNIPGIDHLEIKLKAGSAPGPGDTVPLEMDVDEVAYFDSNITVQDPP